MAVYAPPPYSPEPTPVERLFSPLARFTRIQAASGVVLFAAALGAMAWANSPWADAYHGLWAVRLGVGVGEWSLAKPLLLWINDGLMAVFFFLVGLEIKREILAGELAEPRNALLPTAAALGGMAAPALIYAACNAGGPAAAGWGIPMGTDIAFTLGVLALLGSRVPASLKVFVTALAIADDLGAIVVIAAFYTVDLAVWALAAAAALFALMLTANRLGVRSPAAYALLGAAMWFCFLKSGVHATIGGVLAALAIPASTRLDCRGFIATARGLLDRFEDKAAGSGGGMLANPQLQPYIDSLQRAAGHAEAPLLRLEHGLHPWVAFLVMPVFALANAGVSLPPDLGAALVQPLGLGVILGLVLGKQAGIFGACWVLVRLGAARLPSGASWRQLYGASCLCGIGFTMSIFIATLALGDPALLAQAKVAVLCASLASGIAGWLVLRRGPASPGS